MPTPVGVARQCLTSEAAHALDEAVAVARRRGHAQTTSLHAVSALLSLPSSILRDACGRSRSSSYSSRLQFKALELCLSVSLDRVPSAPVADDPPVSNSFMAAIKRSQANQRRQPENFHLYHQISQQPSSVSCVKVELQQLILSILDDPVVSRVFGEAGFRSPEIKLAILRPLPQLLRYSRSRGPPIFLCNLTEHPDPGRRSFTFPFAGSSGLCDGDENYKRIGEVLSRGRGRNPLLLGACACDALRSFTDVIDKRKDGILPVELCGLHVISIGKDISKFVAENCDEKAMSLKLKKIGQMVEQCVGPGLVVNFGDLKCFVNEKASGEAVSYVVGELGKLLELNYGKFWLMGAAASYDCYLKFVGKFPSVERDWDLQLLPITSVRPSMAESYQKPRSSLMDSFVPFGGLFPSPSDLESPLSCSYYSIPHCLQCGERFRQDAVAASEEKFSVSFPDSCRSFPPWLRTPDLGSAKPLNTKTTKDDGVVRVTNERGPPKEVDETRRHHVQQPRDENTCQTVVGFECRDIKKTDVDNNHSGKITDASAIENIDLNSRVPDGEHMVFTSQSGSPFSVVSKQKFSSRLSEMFRKAEDLQSGDLRSCNTSDSSTCNGSQMSPSSVTTDLGLGLCSSRTTNITKRTTGERIILNVDLFDPNAFQRATLSSSCSSFDHGGRADLRNPKVLFQSLLKRVGWQEEALHAIIRTLVCCQAKTGKHQKATQRGDIWMNFVGPDRHGKKKIAVSLAEFLCGSQESFIFVDLNSEEMKGYDVKLRGKTTLDFIVRELSKKPLSVVFLENVDKADMLAQNSLSQAITTGKLTDSHGREVGVNNSIFVTSFPVSQNDSIPTRESSNYSEERILGTKGGAIKLKVEQLVGDLRSQSLAVVSNSAETIPIPNIVFVNKRKLIGDISEFHYQPDISDTAKRAHTASNWVLDLNLPAEQNEMQHMDGENYEHVSTANQNLWLQNLYDQVDETVVFKPYNFDILADRLLKVIRRNFHKIFGSECALQIEAEAMEQLLAAAYVSDRDTEVEDWADQVLSGAFAELLKRYNLGASFIVKLGTCQDQASGVYLPPKVLID
ncbi:protein SMAX1-LIKE 8-like [Neltuma alba]|uniref:protein SMAX1-LIKE 8-like n=1 Tax=Neltuma alba TaxID=207710 RepID=UPI0010A2CF40|nr:protein SMAX1-LIKE 8-like [Prosopis alba]XP_028793458.1 protein SMAX1-LIKE 8-like [Prosopis alba]